MTCEPRGASGRALALDDDDFALLDLAPGFALDRALLDARWKALQSQVHPDRFAGAEPVQQQQSMRWALRVNEAYRRLKEPLARAAYLCTLNGHAPDGPASGPMPADFLMQQMAWREALDDARSHAAVAAVLADVERARAQLLDGLARLIDTESDWAAAASNVRALTFMRRLADDIAARL